MRVKGSWSPSEYLRTAASRRCTSSAFPSTASSRATMMNLPVMSSLQQRREHRRGSASESGQLRALGPQQVLESPLSSPTLLCTKELTGALE